MIDLNRIPRLPVAPDPVVQSTLVVEELPTIAELRWDIMVGTVGFEERSRYILESFESAFDACFMSAYTTRRDGSFVANLEFALSRESSEVVIESDTEFLAHMEGRLLGFRRRFGAAVRLAIDISSASRTRIAGLVYAVSKLGLSADFLYAPAKFSPPSDVLTPLAFAGPVLPQFVGRWSRIEPRATTIVGIGFEGLEALGAIQRLETNDVWLMIPQGHSDEYVEANEIQNQRLFRIVPDSRKIVYSVMEPFDTFRLLEQMCYGVENTRPVLVPFGPKIFALACLLTSERFNREIPVWRFSSEQYGPAVDVEASGEVVGLRVSSNVEDERR